LRSRLAILALLLVSCSAPERHARPKPLAPPRTRRFELLLGAKIAHPTSATYDVWVPLPPREDGQDVEKLSAEVLPGEGGFDFTRDAYGNRLLHVRRKGDGRPIEVNVTLSIETSERLVPAGTRRELNDVERKALAGEQLSDGVPTRVVQGFNLPLHRAVTWSEVEGQARTESFVGGLGWVASPELSESFVVVRRAALRVVSSSVGPWAERDGERSLDLETRVQVRDL
jgi:hypothetical protein